MARLVPERIGPYTPTDVLGVGGMSSVYLARGPSGRAVALKVVRGEVDRAGEASLREARILGQLSHPNVVRLLDAGLHEGGLYLALELVHGPSLAKILAAARDRGIRMGVGVALRIAVDALEGLRAAHDAAGSDGRPLVVVHRDVSPQNVLVDADGCAKIADFGIAQFTGSGSATRTGEVRGKLAYLAPEQFGAQVDRRSDLYAVAVVLWECLAGRRLFQGDEAAIVLDIVHGNAPSLADVRTDLPPALITVVDRATSRDPARRFADAGAMIEALAGTAPVGSRDDVVRFVDLVLPGERARMRATAARAARPVGSRRWLVAGGVVLASAALLAAGFVLGEVIRDRTPPVADRAREEAPDEPVEDTDLDAIRRRRFDMRAVALDDLPPDIRESIRTYPCRFRGRTVEALLREHADDGARFLGMRGSARNELTFWITKGEQRGPMTFYTDLQPEFAGGKWVAGEPSGCFLMNGWGG